MGTCVGLYSATAATSTATAVANLDVPKSGTLLGVTWSADADLDADLECVRYELSFGSTPGFTTNDSRGRISQCSVGFVPAAAAGSPSVCFNYHDPLPSLPVGAGERIYLHVLGTGTINTTCYATMHFDFDLDQVPVRRR